MTGESSGIRHRPEDRVPDRNASIVIGLDHNGHRPPQVCHAQLYNKFAVIFDTYRSTQPSMYVDGPLMCEVLFALIQAVPHDAVLIDIDDGPNLSSVHEYFEIWEEWNPAEDTPDARITLSRFGTVQCIVEPEPWLACGGPHPYHDSYTWAFYTLDDMTNTFNIECDRVFDELGVNRLGVHDVRFDRQRPDEPQGVWHQLMAWWDK